MRWPSFFGRAAAEKGPRTHDARPTGREWASLPAIQRAVGEPELTAPTAAFVGSLAGTHDPDLSLEPLGHNVSLDGPSGLVIGLVRGVDTYSPSSELVGRPRARRDTTVQRRIVDAEETSAPAAVEHAGADPLPEPEVLSFAAIDGPEPAAALVTAQRLTLGQSRRLGLGAPLSNPEASVAQRSVETPALDLAPPAHSARPDQAEAGSELEPPVAQVEGDEIPGSALA